MKAVLGPVAAAAAVAALLVVGPLAPGQAAPVPDDAPDGRALYELQCSSCHGLDGRGVDGLGPSLQFAGAASAYFYLTSGRMPAVEGEGNQPARKPPAYPPEQIDALVDYVATLGEGPPVPEVDVAGADLARGGVLYRANCASCHNAAGIGGALSYGQHAPGLDQATPTQVVAAMRIGPGQMPVFPESLIPPDEAADIAAYVEYLDSPEDPGGLSLGRVGPITEGFVALLVGLGGVCAIGWWVVRERHG